MESASQRLVGLGLAMIFLIGSYPAAAGTSEIPVAVEVQGIGEVEIGNIAVNDNDGGGGGIVGDFTFKPPYGFLDEWYNFRWINVFVAYTVDGAPEDYDNDGNPDMPQPDFPTPSPPFIELPAIDPVAGPFVGDEDYNDDAPFYFTDAEHAACMAAGFGVICVPGVSSTFSDNRLGWPPGTVITFATYLVAESVTDPDQEATTGCLLAGFEWTYTQNTGAQMQTLSIPSPGGADAARVNTAIANATEDHPDNGTADDGNFGAWTVTTGCTLSECPRVFDCVETNVPGTFFSRSSWTLDGKEIGETFPVGVEPVPGTPVYDTTYLPSEPNDWHWSVFFLWNDIPTEVTVWVVNFPPGSQIDVEIVCSPLYLDVGLMLQVDYGNDIYQLMDGLGKPIWTGRWQDYPDDLPPPQQFERAGIRRQNSQSAIFTDGFESGNTSAWPDVQPLETP